MSSPSLKTLLKGLFMSMLQDSGLPASVDALTAKVADVKTQVSDVRTQLGAAQAQIVVLQAQVAAGSDVTAADLVDLKTKVDAAVAELASV
jgi:hypothetical protein